MLCIFILGQCAALHIKNWQFVEGCILHHGFSNDSDYCRAYVKWKQLKEHRLLNWSRLIGWCVSETVTEWQLICIQCRQCLLYGIYAPAQGALSDDAVWRLSVWRLSHTSGWREACAAGRLVVYSDRISSLLNTCVCFMIIKNCFVVTASYLFFVGIRGSITHFFRAWGNTTHFQNELKETLVIKWAILIIHFQLITCLKQFRYWVLNCELWYHHECSMQHDTYCLTTKCGSK